MNVDRRTGGLEMGPVINGLYGEVDRRTGGLERLNNHGP